MEKQKWVIDVSQNGWEYTGWVRFKANTVEKTGDRTLLVDGVEIEFDEDIKEPIKESK